MRVVNTVKCDHRVGNPIISYTQENCPRCLSKGYYGGIDFDFSGKISTVSNGEGLAQKIKKILTEKKRPSGYGFDYSLVINASVNKETIVRYEVSRCLNYIQNLISSEKSRGIKFNPSEEIQSIENIKVNINENDPREVIVYVTVITKSGTTLSIVKEVG